MAARVIFEKSRTACAVPLAGRSPVQKINLFERKKALI